MSRKRLPPRVSQPVEIEYGGQRWRGAYIVSDDWVEVYNGYGTKKAALHHSPAEQLARILLGELVTEEQRRTKNSG
jgi:hypothetical protein